MTPNVKVYFSLQNYLELRLAMELEEGDVVVQRLAVVVVVDVGGGHPQCLRPRGPVLLREVMVPNTHVDRVSRPNNAETENMTSYLGFISWSYIMIMHHLCK